jgi:hypothetical protein
MAATFFSTASISMHLPILILSLNLYSTDCPWNYSRRWCWQSSVSSHQKACKACRPPWSQLPSHRHSRLQLHQLWRQQNLLFNSVQLRLS